MGATLFRVHMAVRTFLARDVNLLNKPPSGGEHGGAWYAAIILHAPTDLVNFRTVIKLRTVAFNSEFLYLIFHKKVPVLSFSLKFIQVFLQKD